MPDTGAPPPIPPAVESALAAVVAKDVERDSFIETFHVREKGRRYEVAANAVANRALMQMNVAKLRSLGERVFKVYEDHPEMVPSPKDFKILTEAIATIDSMSDNAYSDKKNAGGLANSLERLVYAATRGAAAGAGEKVGSKSPEARLKRLNSIGKKVVEAAPETAETAETAATSPNEQVVELDE